MSNYKQAGVDIEAGDASSRIAYTAAKGTFISRKGMIGEPVVQDGGFAGCLDMGDFYLVMGDDGVGTKMEIAVQTGRFETLGQDLLAMVIDDAICIGAEVVSITNTIDVNKVKAEQIEIMMKGLQKACLEQKVVIAGGEIAELGEGVKNMVWNATAVGIVKKEKMITGEKIKPGDKIISLKSNLLRSNGFSLVRYVLQKSLGENWYGADYGDGRTWGEVMLTPSKLYHNAVLELVGRFGQESKVNVHGVAHITGGGIPGNLNRVLKANQVGAELDNLWDPQEPVLKLQKMGNVQDEEAYKTWNMGNGMLLILPEDETEKALEILAEQGVLAKIAGRVIDEPKITFMSKGVFKQGEFLTFDL